MRATKEKKIMIEKKKLVPTIKCDKCSNEIEDENLFPGTLFSIETREWGHVSIGISNGEYDLCPECVKKLKSFIENKEE
jgi:hypothetical protein